MAELKGISPGDLPQRQTSEVASVVKDFLASEDDAAEITDYEGEALKYYRLLSNYISRSKAGVRPIKRGDRIYLLKEK